MALFDDALMPFGYSGLTPDQIAQVQSQGYFMNPDATQASPQQQSGTGPAVDASGTPQNAAGLGQATGLDPKTLASLGLIDQPEKSLWDKLAAGLGGQDFKDLQKTVAGMGAQQQQLALPPASPPRYPPAQNPYFNIYRRSQTDPRAALKALLGGGLY